MESLTRMFVFGTLISSSTRSYLDVAAADATPAALKGFRKEGLDILESEGDVVAGLTFTVSEKELARLDNYEGIESGLYRRFPVTITTPEGEMAAEAYQLTKEHRGSAITVRGTDSEGAEG